MRVTELTGPALDWAVAKCMGSTYDPVTGLIDWPIDLAQKVSPCCWFPSSNWAQGGPIIENENIRLTPNSETGGWFAHKVWGDQGEYEGSTPLVAAMRCFVANKSGEILATNQE